jgi:non-canonical (house-cleaning) NTP pyrophosphatase
MLIGLGSQSAVKYAAVTHTLHQFGLINAKLVSVKAHSMVNEQPFNEETIIGAHNRAEHTALLVPDATFTIAIESGLFLHSDSCYYDIAIVVARLSDGSFLQTESKGVVFPMDAIQEAKRRGTHTWTVGKILQESRRVQYHNDPHLSLVGRSRADFIRDAVVCLFQILQEHKIV